MFGLIVSGRPVDATPQPVSPTQFAFTIPSIPAFNHIVLFLLPGTQFPTDTAAAVYIQVPPTSDFKLLGGIGPGKESAIFKVSGLSSPNPTAPGGAASNTSVTLEDADLMIDDDENNGTTGLNPTGRNATGPTIPNGANIVVGVSIEPIAQVDAQLAQLRSQSANSTASTLSSSALVRAAPPAGTNVNVNAVGGQMASTKVLAQRIIGNAFNFLASFGSDTVPLKAFQDWWTKFEKRIELDPSFLERIDQG